MEWDPETVRRIDNLYYYNLPKSNVWQVLSRMSHNKFKELEKTVDSISESDCITAEEMKTLLRVPVAKLVARHQQLSF